MSVAYAQTLNTDTTPVSHTYQLTPSMPDGTTIIRLEKQWDGQHLHQRTCAIDATPGHDSNTVREWNTTIPDGIALAVLGYRLAF